MDYMAVAGLNHVAKSIISNHIGSSVRVLDLLDQPDYYRSHRKQFKYWRVNRQEYFKDIRGPLTTAHMHHIKGDPFPDQPPNFIRLRLHNYTFTTPEERKATGHWWNKALLDQHTLTIPVRGHSD